MQRNIQLQPCTRYGRLAGQFEGLVLNAQLPWKHESCVTRQSNNKVVIFSQAFYDTEWAGNVMDTQQHSVYICVKTIAWSRHLAADKVDLAKLRPNHNCSATSAPRMSAVDLTSTSGSIA